MAASNPAARVTWHLLLRAEATVTTTATTGRQEVYLRYLMPITPHLFSASCATRADGTSEGRQQQQQQQQQHDITAGAPAATALPPWEQLLSSLKCKCWGIGEADVAAWLLAQWFAAPARMPKR